MSKDIWHTADAKPKSLKTFAYKTDKGHIGSNMLTIDSGWNPILLPEFYSMDDFDKAERITKWAYLDDLLALETELERTRKALDVAVDAIKSAKTRLELINNSKFANLNNVLQIQCQCEILKIEKSLDKITALEQKDVK